MKRISLSAPVTFIVTAALLMTVGGCEQQTSPQAAAPASGTVYTTFYPTTYFADRIAGDALDVVNPCPADADPAYWMPDDETLAEYQAAGRIVINGAHFEKWIDKVTLPTDRVVNTAKALSEPLIELADAVTHSHGPGGAHTHTGIDGHTWLDPINCKQQAAAIRAALAELRPAQAASFGDNYDALADDLDALDARLKELAPKLTGHTLLANHPAWNYLARRYGWEIKTFHLDPEEMPAAETLAEIKAFIDAHPAKIVLWESAPLAEVASKLKSEFGLTSVEYSPGESRPDAGDFLSVMNANVDRLAAALEE